MFIDNKMYNTDLLTLSKTNYLHINTFLDVYTCLQKLINIEFMELNGGYVFNH